tara:strand:- start:3128 stop:3616 length:489 start_codon:yes stop_codon:yes gene_type:complete
MRFLQLCALLTLASCEQTAGQALMPDEFTLFGSQGVGDGEITRSTAVYDTTGDSYRYGAALTWDLRPPQVSTIPQLDRIARAVEKQPYYAPPVIVPTTGPQNPREETSTTNNSDEQPDDDLIFGMTMSRFAATLGATAAAIATVLAAIKQGQSAKTPTTEPE